MGEVLFWAVVWSVLGPPILYVAVRFASSAFFRSKAEYMKEIYNGTEEKQA